MSGVVAHLVVKVSASISEFTKELQGLEKSWANTGARLQGIGRDLTVGVTLPLAAVGLGAIKAAKDFESSFAGVRKTVDGVVDSQGNLTSFGQQLQTQFRALAKEIPVSVNELNRIGESAGQLGIRSESIMGFTRTIAAMGVATNLSTEQAADGMARFANITQMPQDKINNLGSVIVELGNKLAATESEILEFGLRIAGAGEIVGMTESQILGIGGAISSVGVEAEAGGTAVQKALLSMNMAATTGKGLGAFENVVPNFKELFAVDPAEAFLQYVEGIGKAGKGGGALLADAGIDDQRQVRAFLSIAAAGDLLRTSLKLAGDEWVRNTALTNEAAQRYRTFDSQLQLFKNQINDIGITLGTKLIEALLRMRPAIETVLTALANAVTWFSTLPQPVQTTAFAVLGLAAAVGPIAYVIGSFMKAGAGVAGLLRVMGVGATESAGGASLLSRAFTSLSGFVARLLPSLTSLGGVVRLAGLAFGVMTGSIGLVVAGVTLLAPLVWKMVGGWEGLKSILAPVGAALQGVWQFMTDLATIAMHLGGVALTKVGDAFQFVVGKASALYDTVAGLVQGPLAALGESMKNSFLGKAFDLIGTAAKAAAAKVHEYALEIEILNQMPLITAQAQAGLKGTVFDDSKWNQLPTMSPDDAAALMNVKKRPGVGAGAAPLGGGAAEVSEFTRAVNALVDKIGSSNLVDTANQWVAAIAKLGGVGVLTHKELTQFTEDIAAAVEKMRLLGQEVPRTWSIIANTVTQDAALQKTRDFIGESMRGFEMNRQQVYLPGSQMDTAALSGLMQAIPQSITSQNVSQSVAIAGDTIGRAFKGGWNSSIASLPQTIMSALQGGGDVGKSIGGLFGGEIMSSLSGKLTQGLSGMFGKTIGGALGSVIPGLGTLLGSMIGPLIGKVASKIWHGIQGVFGTDEEARDVNPARDAFLSQFGGAGTGADSGFQNLASKLTELTGEAGGGALFRALTQADTMAEFNAAVSAIEEKLASVSTSATEGFDTTTAATEGFNLSLQGSDEAIKALGETQLTVVNTMLAGFDALMAKLTEFVNVLVGAKTVLAEMPVPDAQIINTAPYDAGQPWTEEVPAFANEGVVRRPTLAMIGDAPEPEYVLRQSTVESLARAGGRAGNGISVNMYISGTVIGNSQEFEDAVGRAFNNAVERGGSHFQKFRKLTAQAVQAT